MAFEVNQRVLFRHCDPAGVVFYPRYFEMINDCLEAFFEDALGAPWAELHKEFAVPTAQINTRFAAPSHQGDHLRLRLMVTALGRTSFTYSMLAHSGPELRFETTGTLVFVDHLGKPTPWPSQLRETLKKEKDQAA